MTPGSARQSVTSMSCCGSGCMISRKISLIANVADYSTDLVLSLSVDIAGGDGGDC